MCNENENKNKSGYVEKNAKLFLLEIEWKLVCLSPSLAICNVIDIKL